MSSLLRLLAGLACIGVLVLAMMPVLLLLLPFRVARIRVTNFFGSLIGRSVMACSGCTVTVSGTEHVSADRPAIYAANHTSILDAFTTIWLTPSGTVGVAKREVLYYPFYGQAWWLAGHVFLDRARTERAKAALRETARFLRENALHLCILPEGTRSESGQLLPFKKGIVHLALETRLPIVPMVTTGLAGVWRKGSLSIRPAAVHVRFLPPLSTEAWTEETVDAHVAELRGAFVRALPPELAGG
ncbi:MAG: 1-acyl-sn-glycerol-3-phosphate acyltransferase [Deltaproteobacteria bacterium]|nr:1-acyl-sn-glycerol-3-phosphate acyltransferase [Deltaproteobacteria bacterium]